MSFNYIIGNNKIKELLTKTIQSQNILHSYIFIGKEGIGKMIFAKEFAKLILCNSANQLTCTTCKSCMEFVSNNHPDYMEINPEEGKSIKIEQIRFMQEKIAEKPIVANKKVYIINDSDKMTKEAQNCLLKTLEEPPEYAVIILVVENENKLLNTIKSRGTKIVFQNLTEQEIENYLNREQIQVPTDIIKACDGSIKKAIYIQEKKEQYEKITQLVKSLETKDIVELWKEAEFLYKAKEDIFALLEYMNIIFYNLVKDGKIQYEKAIKVVEETKKRINANANYDMCIDNLLLRLPKGTGDFGNL